MDSIEPTSSQPQEPSNNELLGLMTTALALWPEQRQQQFLSQLSQQDNQMMESQPFSQWPQDLVAKVRPLLPQQLQ